MDLDTGLSITLLVLIVSLLKCYLDKRQESFSLSTKPFDVENTLLHNSPVDNIDYQTPTFVVKKRD